MPSPQNGCTTELYCVYLCVRGPVAAAPQLSQRCREEATRTTRRGGFRPSASLRFLTGDIGTGLVQVRLAVIRPSTYDGNTALCTV